jgi:hypothetical protein
MGDVAHCPGLTAGTTVSGPSPSSKKSGAPAHPGGQEGSRVAPADPDSPGGPGPLRVMAGPSRARLLQPASEGPDPPSPGKGSGAATCRPVEGVGLALPRASG